MADGTLGGIDEAFARSTARRLARPGRSVAQTARHLASPDADFEAAGDPEREGNAAGLSWIIYGSLTLQFLSAATLFIPGTQPIRNYVRAMPYLAALLPLADSLTKTRRGWRPAGTTLIVGALMLLVVNLLHPTTQVGAGIAQCVFQLAIAAPLFWMSKAVRSTRQFERVLILVFLMNFVSAGLGILQVYYPDRFLPPQFSAQLRDDYVGSLTYVGSDGYVITRPPGLSDVPGGAAVAGGIVALLGLGLSFRAAGAGQLLVRIAAVPIGLAVVYLTQVRSVFLMVIVAAGALALLALRQGRLARAGWLVAVGSSVVVASFLWAASIGGTTVNDRFLNMRNQGAVGVFQENRGSFLNETLGDLLNKYPMGAGVGRWGMMNTSFADQTEFASVPIHVEIQMTGWLLDGGVLMWFLYGGAILQSIFAAFTLTRSPDPMLSDLAFIAVGLQVFVAGLTLAGPIFNTQMGILFWSCAAGLQGAALSVKGDGEAAPFMGRL